MNFNFKEFKRFEKQIILKKIGIQGQKEIRKAKISCSNGIVNPILLGLIFLIKFKLHFDKQNAV